MMGILTKNHPVLFPFQWQYNEMSLSLNDSIEIITDTHTKFSDSQLGEPVTKVYAKPGSLSSVLEGIKKHRVEIFIDLDCDYFSDGTALLPGTDVGNSNDLDLEFSLTLKDGSEPVVLKVIENGNSVEEKNVSPGERALIKRIWKGKSDWIRCEIRDSRNQIRGYINPLHRGRKERNIKVWGDAFGILAYQKKIHLLEKDHLVNE